MRKPFLFLWVAVAVAVIFFWIYFPALSRYRELKIQDDTLGDEIKDLDSKIKTMTDERNLLKNDPAYVEKVIRDELGLVKPGEIVYKFVQEEIPKKEKEEKAASADPKLLPEPVEITRTENKSAKPFTRPSPVSTTKISEPGFIKTALPDLPELAAPSKLKKSSGSVFEEPSYPRQETR